MIPPQRDNMSINTFLQWYFPVWGSALQSVFCVAGAIASVSRPPRDQMMMHILFAPSLTLDTFRHRTTGLHFLSSRLKSISFNSDCLHVWVVSTPSELAIFAKGRKPSCGASMGQEEGHFSTEHMGSNSLLLATSGWLSNAAQSAINRAWWTLSAALERVARSRINRVNYTFSSSSRKCPGAF